MKFLIFLVLLLTSCVKSSDTSFLGKVSQDGTNVLVRTDDGNMVLVSSGAGERTSFSLFIFDRESLDFLLSIRDNPLNRSVSLSEIDEMGIPQLVIINESLDGGEAAVSAYRVEYKLVLITNEGDE